MSINEIFATIQNHANVLLNAKSRLWDKHWSAVRLVHHSQRLTEAVKDSPYSELSEEIDATPDGVRKTMGILTTLIENVDLNKSNIHTHAVRLEAMSAMSGIVLEDILSGCNYHFIGLPPPGCVLVD
jgi:hypothetical protein